MFIFAYLILRFILVFRLAAFSEVEEKSSFKGHHHYKSASWALLLKYSDKMWPDDLAQRLRWHKNETHEEMLERICRMNAGLTDEGLQLEHHVVENDKNGHKFALRYKKMFMVEDDLPEEDPNPGQEYVLSKAYRVTHPIFFNDFLRIVFSTKLLTEKYLFDWYIPRLLLLSTIATITYFSLTGYSICSV